MKILGTIKLIVEVFFFLLMKKNRNDMRSFFLFIILNVCEFNVT